MTVHRLKALDLVVGSPVLGTPSLAVRHVCPVTGRLLETRVVGDVTAKTRRLTAAALKKKNATIPSEKLKALDERVRVEWKKNARLKGNAHGTATTIANGMLDALRKIDPKRYPPIDPADKVAMDKAQEKAAAWICDSLSKTAVWQELGLEL
jgi:hypothetical protein